MQSQIDTPQPNPPAIDLRGRPLHDLRISLTDQCSLRCGYCMPAEVFGHGYKFLKKEQLVRFVELDRIIAAFVRCGVRKLRITGGEPLLRPGVVKFVRRAREAVELEDIALTTNGLRLPQLAGELAHAGLNRVTVSLDAMDDAIFGKMNGRGRSSRDVLRGIAAAQAEGLPVKINMVVQRGVNDSQIVAMAKFFKERGISLRFIEFMDAGNYNHWDRETVVSGREILDQLKEQFAVEPVDASYPGEVAKRYRYVDDGVEFGLITSVSQPFCGDCSRARLSADGRLFTCLFANAGYDLIGRMRRENPDDEALYELVAGLWQAREDRYSESRRLQTPKDDDESKEKVEMSYIGG